MVLDRDFLLAASSVALERIHLHREGPRKFIERAFGSVLLRQALNSRKMLQELHRRYMNGSHLGGEHRLDLIIRLDVLDHAEDEINLVYVNRASRTRVGQLANKALNKIGVRGSQRLREEGMTDVDTPG